jgi:hypothetical protein
VRLQPTWKKRRKEMKKVGIFINRVLLLVCCAVAGMSAADSSAAITPVAPFQAEALPDPNPPAYIYSSSIAYYNNYLIYAGSDGNIYGYNLATNESDVISDTSSLTSGFTAVQGFFVSSDDYLYFHDNAFEMNIPQSIYRLQLSGAWPVAYETLVTDVTSSIFAFTENPWTNAIWFSSSDFVGSGNNFYLYEIDSAFTSATQRATFAKKGDNSGNGPIIFEDETTLLYGESIFGEDGYFHQVNTTTGAVIQADYLTFTGGLVDATYGDNDRIYVTSGAGKTIFELQGSADPLAIGTTDNDAQGIVYGDDNFYISELVPFSSAADPGKTSLDKFWDASPTPVPPISSGGGGGGGGCFIGNAGPGALSQNYALSYLLFPVVLWLGIGIVVRLRRE